MRDVGRVPSGMGGLLDDKLEGALYGIHEEALIAERRRGGLLSADHGHMDLSLSGDHGRSTVVSYRADPG